MSVWDRHTLRSIFSPALLFLGCFYFLYVLIDYSSRISSMSALRFDWASLAVYYGIIFIRRLEVMLPFALLLGTLRTLQTYHHQNTWVAVLGGGVSLRRLLFPFVLAGMVGVTVLYINEQCFLPIAQKKLTYFESVYFHKGGGMLDSDARVSIKLQDGSRLFFDSLDIANKKLTDVWYVPHWNSLWHFEELLIDQYPPRAKQVDEFVRDPDTGVKPLGYYQGMTLPSIRFELTDFMEMATGPQTQSITDLFKSWFVQKEMGRSEKAELTSYLLAKTLMPWLSLLVVLAPIPLAISFSRNSPFFFTYLVSIFGFIVFYLLMRAGILVATSLVASPLVAVALPFFLICSLCGRRFYRFCCDGI